MYEKLSKMQYSKTHFHLHRTLENPSSEFANNIGHIPAWASAKSDQRLCYSLIGKHPV